MTDPASPDAAGGDALRGLIARYRRNLLVAFVVSALAAVPALCVPLVLGFAVDAVRSHNGAALDRWALTLVGLAVLTSVFWFLRMVVVSHAAYGLEADLRQRYFDHLLDIELARIERGDVGQLLARGTADLRAVRTFLSSGLPAVASLVAGFAFVVVVAGYRHPYLGAIAVVPVVGILIASKIQISRGTDLLHESRTRLGDATRDIDEALTGIALVRGFGQGDRVLARVQASLEASRRAMNTVFRRNARFASIVTTLPLIGVVGVLYVGARLAVSHHQLSDGGFVSLYLLLLMLSGPASSLGSVVLLGQAAAGAARRVSEVFDIPAEETRHPAGATDLPTDQVVVRADNLVAAYARGGEPVLEDVRLDVTAGSHVEITGRTGSGKSLLLRLLQRLTQPENGSLSVVGTSVLVTDTDMLFSGTVRDTIAYGRRDATLDEVRRAAELADADQFVSALPHGYDSELGGRTGVRLSGGQQQRLCLARGLLLQPELLLLDQATASLDAVTHERVVANLRLDPRGTVIAVGGVGAGSDPRGQVVVLDAGRVVEVVAADPSAVVTPVAAATATEVAPAVTPTEVTPVATTTAVPPATAAPAVAATDAAAPAEAPPTPVQPDRRAQRRAQRRARRAKNRSRLRAVRQLAAPDWRWYVLMAGVVAVATAAALVPAYLAARVVDDVIDHQSLSELNLLGAALCATVVVVFAATWAQGLLVPWVGQRLLVRLRLEAFRHLLRVHMAYFDRQNVGQLISRLTNNIELLTGLVQNGLGVMISSAVLILGTGIVFVILDPKLALLAYLTVPPLVVLSLLLRRGRTWANERIIAGIGDVTAFMRETLLGIRTVRAYHQEEWHRNRFAELNHDERMALRRAAYVFGAFSLLAELVVALDIALIIWVGGRDALIGLLSVGTLVAFSTYLRSGVGPIATFATMEASYAQSGVALDQLTSMLDLAPDTDGDRQPGERGAGAGLRFDGVWFAYNRRGWVLRGLDLEVPAGQTVLVVGATGAGKSTLVNLALRFYRPIRGQVTIDGEDLADVPDAWLRRQVAIVPQVPFVFSATVADNVAFGRPDAGRAEVEAVLERLGVAEDLGALPRGLDTVVGEGGYPLSSGQRQLIALARALLVDPQVLVLDEATSVLDRDTEAAVERAMATLRRDRTTLVIAHHLATARRVDRIAVLAHGRAVEQGTHEELLAAQGRYAALWRAASAKG